MEAREAKMKKTEKQLQLMKKGRKAIHRITI